VVGLAHMLLDQLALELVVKFSYRIHRASSSEVHLTNYKIGWYPTPRVGGGG
jgi:hypothetical protein